LIGTLLNTAAVVVGSCLGLLLGGRLPDGTKTIVVSSIGLFVIAIGVASAIKTENPLIPLVALVLGSLVGEAIDLDRRITQLGDWLKQRFDRSGGKQNFTLGFVLASLQFCVGPLTILGSIQDGIVGDYSLLATKSVLDGFSSIIFASTFGLGTLFAAATVLVFQGGLALLAGALRPLLITAPRAGMGAQPRVIELAAVGGVILIGLALNILELKRIKVANMLPALIVAPLLVALLDVLGIPIDFGLSGH
jgi:uncharacterized membrane protein YqgA involved in biofilm formation